MAESGPFFEMLCPSGEFHFERSPDEAKGCVICLHGFGGSPWETRPIAEHLYQLGFSADCPLFPGHGIKDPPAAKRAISAMTASDYVLFCTKLIEEKRKDYAHVYLFGQSLGGIIGIYLTGLGLADATAVTVPPLKLPFGAYFLAKFTALLHLSLRLKKPPMEIGWSYEFLNARSSLAVFDLMQLARANLRNIAVPFLACFSQKDGTTRKTPAILQADIPETLLTLRWFDQSGHVMPLDIQAPEIIQCIGDFFNQL